MERNSRREVACRPTGVTLVVILCNKHCFSTSLHSPRLPLIICDVLIACSDRGSTILFCPGPPFDLQYRYFLASVEIEIPLLAFFFLKASRS